MLSKHSATSLGHSLAINCTTVEAPASFPLRGGATHRIHWIHLMSELGTVVTVSFSSELFHPRPL